MIPYDGSGGGRRLAHQQEERRIRSRAQQYKNGRSYVKGYIKDAARDNRSAQINIEFEGGSWTPQNGTGQVIGLRRGEAFFV